MRSTTFPTGINLRAFARWCPCFAQPGYELWVKLPLRILLLNKKLSAFARGLMRMNTILISTASGQRLPNSSWSFKPSSSPLCHGSSGRQSLFVMTKQGCRFISSPFFYTCKYRHPESFCGKTIQNKDVACIICYIFRKASSRSVLATNV